MLEVAIKFPLFENEIRNSTVIIPEGYPTFIGDFLKVAGIDNYKVMKGSCFIKKLTIITNPISGKPNPIHLEKFRNWIFEKVPVKETGTRKIYISRKLARARKVVNEQEVLILLERLGFECVQMEGKAWTEQVNIFQNCSLVVSIHGAGLTNALFMKPGGSMIELYPEDKDGKTHLNPCYQTLCGRLGVKHQFLFVKREETGKPFDFHNDNVTVDIDRLEKLLLTKN